MPLPAESPTTGRGRTQGSSRLSTAAVRDVRRGVSNTRRSPLLGGYQHCLRQEEPRGQAPTSVRHFNGTRNSGELVEAR
eukprot:4814489-Pyramimonas_sp.AAC.1